MKCRNCGAELNDGSVFCAFCGSKQEIGVPEAPVQGTPQNQVTPQGVPQSQVPFQGSTQDGYGSNQAPLQGMPQFSYIPKQITPQDSQMSGETTNSVPPQGVPQSGYTSNQVPPQGVPQSSYTASQVSPQGAPYYNQQQGMPPYGRKPVNKKKNLLIAIIAASSVLVMIIAGVILLPRLIAEQNIRRAEDALRDALNNSVTMAPQEEEPVITEPAVTTVSPAPGQNDPAESDPVVNDPIDSDAGFDFSIKYSYWELPDVISLDSDSRFVSIDYVSNNGIATYQYRFDDLLVTEDIFNSALDTYSQELQTLNSFFYEQEYSENQYAETGKAVLYFTKDDICLAISSSVDDAYYAYVSIFSISEQAGNGQEINFPNYINYVQGREVIEVYEGQEYLMDNGVYFYFNNLYFTDMGDGTMKIEVDVDLASSLYDNYVYDFDFMVMPMDSNEDLLSDAEPISSIYDVNGYQVTTPVPLSTETYENYTLVFYVPAETVYINFYGTNMLEEGPAGVLYSAEMQLF